MAVPAAEKLIVKKTLSTYQVGPNGLLRPVMLMNEMQAIADMHASVLGVGREYCLSKGIGWVITHCIVDILEMPNEKEELSFITWPSLHEVLKAARDFEVRGADGRLMVRATSQWIVIDLETRRPLKLADNMPGWICVPERALEAAFDKFPDFDCEHSNDFRVRYDDIDVNRHVNNAVYTTWATESLGSEFLESRRLRGLKINFKKEISADTKRIQVAFAAGSSAPAGGCITRHLIKTGDTVNAIVVCEWE